jgi:hypothetical protein
MSKPQILPPGVTAYHVGGVDFDALRKPFPPEQIGKLPASRDPDTGKVKRPALDYVGHAAVTDRLNRVLAGAWSYTVDAVDAVEGKCWIRGTMTIDGVSRVEFGDGDDPKEAIGNFLRRAAMRWGVGIDLWSREELDSALVGGEAGGVDSVGGDRGSAKPSPPSRSFPIDQAVCKHRDNRGRPAAQIVTVDDGTPITRCSLCGMPWVAAMEGTTEDLGT